MATKKKCGTLYIIYLKLFLAEEPRVAHGDVGVDILAESHPAERGRDGLVVEVADDLDDDEGGEADDDEEREDGDEVLQGAASSPADTGSY